LLQEVLAEVWFVLGDQHYKEKRQCMATFFSPVLWHAKGKGMDQFEM
jgi:hypothetical protein